MQGKKQLLAEVLFRTGTLHAIKGLLRDRVVVLNYHRIRPDDASFSTLFDDAVYGPTVSQFEDQMLWLKQTVRILSEAELIEFKHARRGPGEMSVVITADDGYLDNYTRVFPVLRRHRIPAIFFIPSSFIESRRLGWWDHLAYLLKRTAKQQITYDGRALDLVQRRDEAFAFLNRTIIDQMRGLAHSLLDDLAQICEVDPPSAQAQDRELMTWEQLQEMHQHDIAIGSHTHTHPILSGLDPERQREELTVSKELIQRRVGCAVRSVAYPVGARAHFTAETQRIAKQSGYELGFSFYSGPNRWTSMDPFDVRRVGARDDRVGLAGAAILPEWLSWDK